MEDEESYVYVIADSQVVMRKVTPGFYGDKYIESLEGIGQGDLIIVNPQDVTA